ncbi:hypothetical protein ACEN2T_23270 [Pseudomonas sp. W22_MBD1_FP4]|uniref:hypothetical protein n=1 Tax=Pseudomonas sp. W22_MBD1_FP4 TaxID=3240272 RepID=UPI003F9B410A
MGRKRTKHDVQEVINDEKAIRPLDLREDNGFYPLTTVWRWRPQAGKDAGELVSLTVDAQNARKRELLNLESNPGRMFYSEYIDEYPWAVKALAQGLKTICLETRISHSEASYKRNAVGMFFDFCRRKSIKLNSFKDLNFQLICEWRADLRSVEMASRYKSTMFRRCCVVIERIMGTDLMPGKFSMPIYASDAPAPLAPYSDAVMYQLIAAVTSDIESLMNNAREFSEIRDHPECHTLNKLRDGYSHHVVETYCKDLSFRTGEARFHTFLNVGELLSFQRADFGTEASITFQTGFPYVCLPPPSAVRDHLRRLAEREVPSKESLFSFLVFFLIFSGKNLESVMGWKRRYNVKGYSISPLDWKDPFDPRRCRLRGYKGRGKGRARIEIDDTYVSISDEGIYPVLEFFLWYSEPLSQLVSSRSKDSLWLYFRKDDFFDYAVDDVFSSDAKKFLLRHEIWDLRTDEHGSLTKERILTLDSRRFRKVYATRELLKAIGEARNYQELHASLAYSLNHKDFDTTLSRYLALGAARTITDIAIFTLQQKYLEEARKFRGVRVEKGGAAAPHEVPGFYASCSDPSEPDYEGALVDAGSSCHEYDMCLGCRQSRVFEQHLPRIATRILQYESMRLTLADERWEIEYGRKYARAHDLLSNWSDQEAVYDAWADAKSGAISLPVVIARG